MERVQKGRVVMGIAARGNIPIQRGELRSNTIGGGTAKCTCTDTKLVGNGETQKAVILLAIRPSLMRNDYEVALAQRSFYVLTADDGVHCLNLLRESLPAVLVIEPNLSWGGGDGVLDVFHQELELHHVPVFALTSELRSSATYSISRFKISDFAMQPLAAKQLADRVGRLAAQRRTALA